MIYNKDGHKNKQTFMFLYKGFRVSTAEKSTNKHEFMFVLQITHHQVFSWRVNHHVFLSYLTGPQTHRDGCKGMLSVKAGYNI